MNDSKTLKLGTRRSLLAWSQSGWVAREIERLNLGEFVHYECPDGSLYEIRLLSVEGFDTATLLVTRTK